MFQNIFSINKCVETVNILKLNIYVKITIIEREIEIL